MFKRIDRNENRIKRHKRIRRKISGTPETPRMTVYKSNTNIYAQIIDDVAGKTLVSCSTLEKGVKEGLESTSSVAAAKKVGEMIAKKALEKGIEEVVFDRAGYIYHGKVKELADGARSQGLKL